MLGLACAKASALASGERQEKGKRGRIYGERFCCLSYLHGACVWGLRSSWSNRRVLVAVCGGRTTTAGRGFDLLPCLASWSACGGGGKRPGSGMSAFRL